MVVKEIPVPVVIGLEGIYRPSFPYPKDGIILPLDENNKVIYEDRQDAQDAQVVNVVMPYWYWKLIIKFAKDTETAFTALEAANQVDPLPP